MMRLRSAPLFTSALRPACAAVAVCGATLLDQPASAELRPGWESLPGETVFALRMPDTAGFVEQLREQTIFGQRVLTEERLDGLKQLFMEENAEEWEEFTGELESYGFTPEDLVEIGQEPWGMGVVLEPREGIAPRAILMFWADLEEDVIDRVFAAQERAMEEDGAEHATTRTDVELAGLDTRQLMIPEIDWVEDADGEWNEGVADQTLVLMTRLPGRMVVALGTPQADDTAVAGDGTDWEAVTDAELVRAVTARFLESMQAGKDGAFAARILGNPDAAAVVPMKDESLVELYGDVQPLLDLARAGAAESGDEPQFDATMQALGFDTVGVFAGSYYLSDEAIRGHVFAQMSEPRNGLPATLDAATLPAEPPAWVPTDMSYGHLGYDLSKLYDVIVAVAQAVAPEQAMQQIQMANGMVQMQTQSDIPSILRAFGTAHRIVVLPSRKVTMEIEEWDYDSEEFVTIEREVPTQPVAVVWDIADQPLMDRLLNAAIGFAAMGGQGVEPVEEQGFRGLRMTQAGPTVSLMLGPQQLVVGVGPDVTSRVLSLLNNPPAADASLAGSPLMAEARALLGDALKPGLAFQMDDGGRSMAEVIPMVLDTIRQEAEFNGDDVDTALLDRIETLMPSAEDMEASFGVNVGVGTMTGAGLRFDGALSTPAP